MCDPFCGSGTTGIEAIRLGRCCRQSDINRSSVHVASGKLAAFSGQGVRRALSGVLDALMLELGAERKWAFGADGCGDAVGLEMLVPSCDLWAIGVALENDREVLR